MRRRDKNFESMIIMRHLRNFLIDNKITCRSLVHIPATKKGKVARTLSNKEYGIRWTSFSLQLIVLRIFVNDVAVGAKSLCNVSFFVRHLSSVATSFSLFLWQEMMKKEVTRRIEYAKEEQTPISTHPVYKLKKRVDP